MDESQRWYLLKHDDGALFGPINFDQLKQWALEAQISPQDKVSNDGKAWIKAPMVPELQMDYLIEVSPDQFYGPTTVGAVREFYQMGEIDGSARVTNCRDGSESLIGEVPELMAAPESETPEGDDPISDEERPVRTSIRLNLQQRIRELETALHEERQARATAEHVIGQLEGKLAEFSGMS